MAKFLPVKESKFQIYNVGGYAKLVTDCGLTVTWNGRTEVIVTVPRYIGHSLVGLCGNCDGVNDDDKLRNGTDVSRKRHRSRLIGESFQVKDDSDLRSDE